MADHVFPGILSDRVSVSSVSLPLDAGAREELERSGVRLPETLAKAIEKRQEEFLGGRLCAWRALTRAGAPGDVSARISVGEDRAPVWPSGWVGSITHGDGFAAAAVARSTELKGLGIDTERVMGTRTASEVRSSILTAGDVDLFNKLIELKTGLGEQEFLTLVFSAKESFYKCIRPAVGVFFGFHDAEIVGISEGLFKLKLLKSLSEAFPKGWSLEGRYVLSQGRIWTSVEHSIY